MQRMFKIKNKLIILMTLLVTAGVMIPLLSAQPSASENEIVTARVDIKKTVIGDDIPENWAFDIQLFEASYDISSGEVVKGEWVDSKDVSSDAPYQTFTVEFAQEGIYYYLIEEEISDIAWCADRKYLLRINVSGEPLAVETSYKYCEYDSGTWGDFLPNDFSPYNGHKVPQIIQPSPTDTVTTVDTVSALRTALQTAGEQTIIIDKDINITGNQITIPSAARITLKSNGNHKLSAAGFTYGVFFVKKGAELFIDGDDDNKITFTNTKGRFMEIEGNVTINNGIFTGNTGSDGGALYVAAKGQLVMNGGAISSNNSQYGGGVSVEKDAVFIMNGGEISNNTAKSTGGGLSIDGEFIMNGGHVFSNKAYEGGGVYLNSDGKATLNAGYFYKNTASSTFGGAIGTGNARRYESIIHNAVIVNNTANAGDGRGGGIWSCPQGTVRFEEESVLFGTNTAKKWGDQLSIESDSPFVIPQTALGGDSYEWYWNVNSPKIAAQPFVNGETPYEFNGYRIALNNTTAVNSTTLEELTAEFSEGKVFIFDNTAACGGGVGGNGWVSFVADKTHFGFINTYTPPPEIVEAKIDGQKIVEGENAPSEVFTFCITQVTDITGNAETEDGYTATFTSIKGEWNHTILDLKDGTYFYKITEQAGKTPHWTYDSSVYVVKIVVENGNAKVFYQSGTKITFTNKYEVIPTNATFDVVKTTAGDGAPTNWSFDIELYSASFDGSFTKSARIDTKTLTNALPMQSFTTGPYIQSGIYYYLLEEKDAGALWAIDRMYLIKVTVAQDLAVTVTYKYCKKNATGQWEILIPNEPENFSNYTAAFAFENTYIEEQKGNLEISKLVSNSTQNTLFEFTVKTANGTPIPLGDAGISISKIGNSGILFTNDADLVQGKFKISHDTTVKIYGLDIGDYTVTETASGYMISYKIDDNAASGISNDTANASITVKSKESTKIVFTNLKTSIILPKTGGSGSKMFINAALVLTTLLLIFFSGTFIYKLRKRKRSLKLH